MGFARTTGPVAASESRAHTDKWQFEAIAVMDKTKASQTAALSALHRAVHQVLDNHPKILDDPLAVGFVPGAAEHEIMALQADFQEPIQRRTRSGLVLRSRFMEDQLRDAVEAGVQQYLLLGAGFDTFSCRQPSWASDLQIIEVDHPATQAEKLACLSSAGLKPPGNVSFHFIDFEEASLVDGLATSRFSAQQPTFVSWLGVTMYLTRPAIQETLRFVLSLPRPSRIVFSFYKPPSSIEDLEVREQTESIIRLAAEHGEPMVSLFEPQELKDWLHRLGFSKIRHFTADEAQDLYYRDRSDGLSPYTAGQNMCAEV